MSAARGKQLYDIHCFTCHGKAGERGAVPLRDVAPALDDTAIADAIVNGMPGKGMPRPPTLSAEQIADLVALIRSWQE